MWIRGKKIKGKGIRNHQSPITNLLPATKRGGGGLRVGMLRAGGGGSEKKPRIKLGQDKVGRTEQEQEDCEGGEGKIREGEKEKNLTLLSRLQKKGCERSRTTTKE